MFQKLALLIEDCLNRNPELQLLKLE